MIDRKFAVAPTNKPVRHAMWIGMLLCLSGMQMVAQAPATLHASQPDVATPFVGDWTGVLEYRDYQTNEHTQLPTWLTVAPDSKPGEMTFTYTYDDGPTKTVIERSTVHIDAVAKRYTIVSAGEKGEASESSFDVQGLDSLADKGRGVLTLIGTGIENDKKVDVRITITIGRNIYKYLKETRLPGQEFLFRDGYTFTRRAVPSPTATTSK